MHSYYLHYPISHSFLGSKERIANTDVLAGVINRCRRPPQLRRAENFCGFREARVSVSEEGGRKERDRRRMKKYRTCISIEMNRIS